MGTKSKTPKKQANSMKSAQQKRNYIYADPTVQNYSYSDYVRVRTGPRGTLLSFGKSHPEHEEFVIFKEILLPLDVTYSLTSILQKQYEELIEQGVIQVEKKKQPKKGKQ